MSDALREAISIINALKWADKHRIGEKVRTPCALVPKVHFEKNSAGAHFWGAIPTGRVYWYGRISEVDFSRPDSILVVHPLGNQDDAFVAWYRPEDVVDGW